LDSTVNVYPGEIFKGKLAYISSTVEKEGRAVRARVEVPLKESVCPDC